MECLKIPVPVSLVFVLFLAVLPSCNPDGVFKGSARGPDSVSDNGTTVQDGGSIRWEDLRKRALALRNIKTYGEFRGQVLEMALARNLFPRALEQGLDRTDLELIKNMSRFRHEELGDLYLSRVVKPKVKISEEEYESAVGGHKYEDVVYIRVLLPREPSLQEKVEEGIRAGKGFETLMEEFGTETGKKTRGKIGAISRSNSFIPVESRDLVFGHRIGEVFGPVATYVGNIFIVVDEKFSAEELEKSARKEVEPKLWDRAFGKELEKEYKRLKTKYNLILYGPKDNVVETIQGKPVKVFARVGNTVVTTDDLAGGEGSHHKFSVLDRERRLLRTLYQILFSKEGEAKGLDKDPDYREKYQEKLEKELFSAYKARMFWMPVDPPSMAEMKEFYEMHKEKRLFRYPHVSYLVLRGIPPEREEKVKALAKGIQGKKELEKTAKELGVGSDLVLRRRLKEVPKELRGMFMARLDNAVFSMVGMNGTKDVYKQIHLDMDEYLPTFDGARGLVERMVVTQKRRDRLDRFIVQEIGALPFGDREIKELYSEYRLKHPAEK
jgi:hypothetical protein